MSFKWYLKTLFVPRHSLTKPMRGNLTPEAGASSDDDQDWVRAGMRPRREEKWEETTILDRDLFVDAPADDLDVEVYVNNDKHMPSEPSRRRRAEFLPPKLDAACQRTSHGVGKTWRAAKNAPAFTQDALSGAISASMSAFEQTDVKDLSILTTPLNVGLAALGGASGTVARTLAREANGAKDTRVAASVDRAEAHFKAGESYWTEPQARTAKEWIAEARRSLEDFANNDYVGMGGGSGVDGVSEPTRNKLVGDYFRIVQGEANNRNPSKVLLKQKAAELYCLVAALEKFSKIPYKVKEVSPDDVLARLEQFEKRGEFIGAQTHKDSLMSVALDCASNSTAAADRQVKYLPVSIEGPGTGKSTCAEMMMKSTGQAYIKISGEMIKSWIVPKEAAAKATALAASRDNKGDDKAANSVAQAAGDESCKTPKDICDLLMDEIKKQLQELQETNVFILLDDLHIAWDKSTTNDSEGNPIVKGPFARDPQAFNKMMDVWKTCTDAAQDRVPGDEVELSPDVKHSRKFPLSFKRVQFFITGNQEHDAFNPKKSGSEWLTSRLRRMGTSYMTADDRLRTCVTDWRGKINTIIANHYLWAGPDLERVEREVDQTLAKATLREIALLDIDVATGRFGGENGHRGLIFFLKNFEGYITRQLKVSGKSKVNPDIYSLQGTPPYNMQTVMAGISDYNKARDQQLIDQKDQDALQKTLGTLRARISELRGAHLEHLTEHLVKAEAQSSIADKKALVRSAELLLSWYGGRVKAPKLQDLLSQVEEEFKDTKAAETSEDVDGFRPMKNFVVGLLARKKMTDDGEYNKSINRIVRVRLAHPSADNQGFFEKLGDMLGGIPVKALDADSFLSMPSPLPSFDRNAFTADPTQQEKYDAIAEAVRYNNNIMNYNGGRFRVTIKEFKTSSRSYFYVSHKLENDELGHFVFEPQHLSSITGGQEIDATNTALYKLVKSKQSIGEVIAEREMPRLAFLDVCAKTAHQGPSMGEPYLVARLSAEVQTRILAWAQLHNGGNALEPNQALRKFQEHISGEVLNRERVSANGKDIDPRAITLFLVDGAEEAHNPVASNDDKIVTTITLAPPTLEGRSARADSAIKRTLHQVIREAYWKTPEKELPVPVLQATEQKARDALVQFDRQQAQTVRDDKSEILSTALLERVAVELAKLIGERFTLHGVEHEGLFSVAGEGGSFAGYEGLPSQRDLQKSWAAEYKAEVARIDAELEARAAEAERIEKEKRAAEDRKKSWGGGYAADYGYTAPETAAREVTKVAL